MNRCQRTGVGLQDECSGERWFADWVSELDVDSLRCIVRGVLSRGADVDDESMSPCSIVVPSVEWRDELMVLLMHAGYAAWFERDANDHDRWRVTFSSSDVEPSVRASKNNGAARFSAGRTWCFDMRTSEALNGGFVVVRRAQRKAISACFGGRFFFKKK